VASNRARPRISLVLLVTLLVALAIGAAASLIVGAATSSSGPSPHVYQLVVPIDVLEYGVLALVALFVGMLLYRRMTERTTNVLNRPLIALFTAFLIVGLIIIALGPYLGSSSSLGPAPSSQNSNGVSPPGNQSASNLTKGGNVTPLFLPHVPPWVPFVLLAAVLLIVALIALPAVRAFAEDRRSGRGPAPKALGAQEVRLALQQAAVELDLGGDPRTVIMHLYRELLGRLRTIVGSVTPQTPAEIRELHLLRLGIRPEAALILTGLFEEARYSSHPLDANDLARARLAVAEALEDLTRSAEPT
jgi:hypothetical protein